MLRIVLTAGTVTGALALALLSGYAPAAEEMPAAEVTIKGNVLCYRATIPVPWDQTSQDADHIPVIYAFEGTPEITAQLHAILDRYYPAKGLDADTARKFLDAFTVRLRYFVAPGALTDRLHKEVEWGSQILALTGTLSEQGGRRWIHITRYEPSTVAFPAKMLAPDRPFVLPDRKPLLLKVTPALPEGQGIRDCESDALLPRRERCAAAPLPHRTREGARSARRGDTLTLQCVPIPAGRFLQGSPFYQPRYQDEFPHEVVLTKPFYMAEIPVTQAMFAAVLGRNPSPVKGQECPVEGAAWTDVLAFCRTLSEQNHVRVRVPTDAEWEYAARVGTSNPCFTEKYRDQISAAGAQGSTTPVKSRKPNAWGLYDMLCGGWHVTGSYKADNARAREVDPQGPPKGDRSIQTGSAGPMHKSRGGYHYSFIRPNMHGAVSEDGGLWEGGTQIFRILVEE
jgi:formylglycine-generating enzyme required for sulfatase activity